MILLSVSSAIVLAAMLGIALWNLLTAPRLERAGEPGALPRVSLLVPARNEAETLRETLPALLRIAYPELEVLVLDDESSDGTRAVVEGHTEPSGGRLRLLQGRPLPDGWLGKSWACRQLADAASGEILVFCDADVTVRPGALSRTVAAMQRRDAAALTAFPLHRFGSWIEAAVIPLVAQLPILTLLPLALVARTRSPALAVGNGQWLAFTRVAYEAIGGHAAVRDRVVEDVELARRVKASGLRLLPLVSTSLLEIRMYRSPSEVRAGFAKNVYALVGGRPTTFALAVAVFTLAGVYPWVGALLGIPGRAPAARG